MPSKLPICQFSVDSKLFPQVHEILKIVERGDFLKKGNKSRFICQAIMESYQKHKDSLLDMDNIEDLKNDLGDSVDFDDDSIIINKGELLFDSHLPSIAEPISSISFDQNRTMWECMTEEDRNHTDRFADTLKDGVDRSNKEIPGTFCSYERRRHFLNIAGEDGKKYVSLIDKDFIKLATFINERSMKPRDVRQWRVQRIAELQEEINKLTKEQKYEDQQEEEEHQQKQKVQQQEIPKS